MFALVTETIKGAAVAQFEIGARAKVFRDVMRLVGLDRRLKAIRVNTLKE